MAGKMDLGKLAQLTALVMGVGSGGVSVGYVLAQVEDHRAQPGHHQTIERVSKAELTLERVVTVLEVLQRLEERRAERERRSAPGG